MNPDPQGALSVLHLNAYDTHGGAERLAGDLMRTQRGLGHRAEMLVGKKCDPFSAALSFDPDPDPVQHPRLRAAGLPDYELRGSHRLIDHPAVKGCQVIHIHNLYGGYFNPFSLVALSQFRPVIWSIHDMQAITGYCAHALDCPKWKTGCGACPDLTRPGPWLPVDSTARLWSDKQSIYRNSRLWIVGASSWIVGQLEQSILNVHPIRKIPNGIDTRIFSPRDRDAARKKLGLPPTAPVVAGLARSGALAHPWKGGKHALAALEILRRRFPHLIYLNLGAEGVADEKWIRHAATESPDEMAEWLSAADVLLYPSIADTAPLAVMEALSCGVPVVAFRLGGLTDQVRHGETGFLAEPGDATSLAEGISQLLADRIQLQQFRETARRDASQRFDISLASAAYVDWYRTAIIEFHGGEMPAPTSPSDGSISEMVRLQNELMQAKAKLKELRSGKKRDLDRLQKFIRQPWIKAGLRLRFLPREVRKWASRFRQEDPENKSNPDTQ